MSSRECPFCGERLHIDDLRCTHCYKSLLLHFSATEATPLASAGQVRPRAHTHLRTIRVMAVGFGAPALVLALLVFLAWL